MKARKLFVLLPALLLVGCSDILLPTGFQEGVVDTPTQKTDVKRIYNEALDTTEDMEDFVEEDATETPETPDVPEVEEPSEEVPSTPEVEEPTEEEETPAITSYHVDYSMTYSMSASIGDFVFYETDEKHTYSLTHVKEGEDVFMELDMTHEYNDSSLFGDYSGKQSVNAIYQEDKLYITQTFSNSLGHGEKEVKTAHDIKRRHIHHEYSDYFLLMSVNAMFDPTSRENNNALLEELLTNETVEIVDVSEDEVKIKFDYYGGVATMVFDTELKAFKSITFDKSKQKEDVNLDEEVTEDETPETPEVKEAYKGHKDHDNEEEKGNDVVIDEYTYLVTINFSYNDQIADKLTDEEKAEYRHRGYDYGHKNHYDGYQDNHDYGYHGGKDEHHGHGGRNHR